MTMTGMAMLWWWEHAWLFAGVSFIAQPPPSVTPLRDFCGSYSRKFVIFCEAAGGKGGCEGPLRSS